LVAVLFAAANTYSYFHMQLYSTIDDGFVYFGWPFAVYAYGGYFGHPVVIWTGLIGNVFIALCAGRVLGRTVETILTNRRALNRGAAEQIVEPERNQLVSHSQDLNA